MRWLAIVAAGLVLLSLAHAEWKFSGYTQARYNFHDSDLDKSSGFDIRRARIKAEGDVSSDTTFKIQLDLGKLDDDGADEIGLKDLLFTRKLNDQWKGAIGFTSVHFGFEVPYSSSKRLPLERSYAANKLFPGERDTGLYFHYAPENSKAPEVVIGVSNGMADWYDADSKGNEDTESWALVARAQWKLSRDGVAGLSYRRAGRTRMVSDVETDFCDNLLGVHVRYNFPRNFALQGEYYDGTDLEQDVTGWYGQAEYAFTDSPATVFYRYDTYDFGGMNDYARNTLGVAWDRGKNERITIQGEDYDDGKGNSFTNAAVQYQFKY